MRRFEKGLVQVYTGNGKGKTTAALGLALRLCGHGGNVAIVQFMKGWEGYGEVVSLALLPHVRLERTGTADYVHKGQASEVDLSEAQRGIKQAAEWCSSGEFDLVILDEINVAVDYGLVEERQVLDILEGRPEWVEVVLTGRYAPESFIRIADLVTEMREVKHPYHAGLKAREGIEF